MADFRELPECLVTYDIEQAGGAVKLDHDGSPFVERSR